MKAKRHLFIYIGGGLVLIIILSLVLLSFFGLNLWPFNKSVIPFKYVTYRSTEMLYFDGNYSGFEYLRGGDEISYFVQSDRAPISFGIWDRIFEELPTKTLYGGEHFQTSLENNQFYYYSLFLRPGSSIFYNFTVISGSSIEFFIVNATDFYLWNAGSEYDFYYRINETLGEYGNFSNIFKSLDYFLVWNNKNLTNSIINCAINYTATNTYDFSIVDIAYEQVFLVPQENFTVPFGRSGNWFFFIYYDPLFSFEESTAITFRIIYKIREN